MSDNFSNQQNYLNQTTTTTNPHATGLSIAALVLGILAILGSWIPFINLISIVMGILAIIFGIICLVTANRDHIGKDFPLIGIVLGSLTILISLFITLGTFYLIGSAEPETKANTTYDLKIDELPNKPLEEMTNEEFLTTYGLLADDYENLVEIFQKTPYDIAVYNQIAELSERWDELMTQFEDNEDNFPTKNISKSLKLKID